MFKIKNSLGHRFKSYNIEELGYIITSNPKLTYEFFIDYKPIQPRDFVEKVLEITKNHKLYMELVSILKTKKSITDYYGR
tara:strand:- start:136 stop:375 length:240 start_codon:yes stop_codon:yes gene_type:complete